MLNYLLNELAYNPPGKEEGYLFWPAWANHVGATVFSTQDAHGPIRHGLVLASCSTLQAAPPAQRGQRRSSARSARCSTPPTRRPTLPDDHVTAGRGAQPGEEPLMQKQAPSLGRILVMVGFALSCFGLLLFLWLAFGGPIPLKPKGYRFNVAFGEAATLLAQEADVRISGVSVGKVKTIEPDKRPGASDATIELDAAYAPIPKDATAILRQKTLLGETYVELTPGSRAPGRCPRTARCRRRRCRRRRARRDLPRVRREDARSRSTIWMQQLALAVAGPRARHQRRARQPRAVRRGHDARC